MNIEKYIKNNFISKIVETELDRYINFFNNSYKDNLEHSKFVLNNFPRWSIISGYYAMHDITKLFLVKKFGIKIENKVHKTTIIIFKEIIEDKEILNLLELGYEEFIKMANDLSEAKKERLKLQYYTGSEFMAKEYKKKADIFLNEVVNPFVSKLNKLIK
ncbi:MAG: hypothetical protein AABW83_02945 [Nanoarchaeota archaeon]